MKTLPHLLDQNSQWADAVKKEDSNFFSRLAKGQQPEILWIGCSDSRVPASQILNQPPGELFVHRNIANVVVHTDLNLLSVLQYAVEALQVQHVIVCGHYGCGGVQAALEDQEHGLIDNWLGHIKDVAGLHAEELKTLPEEKKIARLCELNVIEQVENVSNTPIVQNAWKKKAELFVHGWIYDIATGRVKDLEVSQPDPV